MESVLTFRGLAQILQGINGKFLQISRNDEDNYIMPFKKLHSFLSKEKDKEVLVLQDIGVEEEYSNIKKLKESDIEHIEILDHFEYENEILTLSVMVIFVTGKALHIIFN